MPDIIVAGGGAVGLTAATLLAQAEFEVTLLEARQPATEPLGTQPDLRVLAVTPASQKILRRCGAWERLDLTRVTPWKAMKVWERDDTEGIEFTAANINNPLSYTIESRALLQALSQAFREAGGTLLAPEQVENFSVNDSGVEVELASGESQSATILLAADGAHSKLREKAGLEWNTHSYRESAIIAEIEVEHALESTAWQRFTPEGTVALLPLFNQRHSLVWSSTQAQEYMQMDDEAFGFALADALDYRLGSMRVCGLRKCIPLERGFASRWSTANLALLGDAAHVVHPLAGLGQNLGLMDAAILEEEMRAHPLSQRALRTYERRRKSSVRMMQWVLEGLRTGFTLNLPLLDWVRSQGLYWAGYSRWLRRFFMQRANGMMDAPEWLRTELEHAVE